MGGLFIIAFLIACLNPSQAEFTDPPSPDTAPPGFYMLFLLNTGGVPSEAALVKLQ